MHDALISTRLLLRAFAIDDVDSFARICGDPAISLWASRYPGSDPSAAADHVAAAIHAFESGRACCFAIEHLAERRLMGEVCLDLRSSLLSYLLGAEFRGNGYATEAVRLFLLHARQQLRMHLIMADVVRENMASRRVLEGAGFQFQFLFRNRVEVSAPALLRYRVNLSPWVPGVLP
jgi:RimJ/RimL family protein N-acetyltransferase